MNTRPPNKSLTHEERRRRKQLVVNDLLRGDSVDAVANRYGLSESYIKHIAKPDATDFHFWVDLSIEDRSRLSSMFTSEIRNAQRARRESIAEELRNGESHASVAARHGITRQRVHQISQEFGIGAPGEILKSRLDAEVSAVERMRGEGRTASDMANALGIQLDRVHAIIRRLDAPLVALARVGTCVSVVAALLRSKAAYVAIADEHQVSERHVRHVISLLSRCGFRVPHRKRGLGATMVVPPLYPKN